MKKSLLIAVAGMSLMFVSCNKETKTAENQDANLSEKTDAAAESLSEPYVLAYDLAVYGYETASPMALIEAADILVSTPTQPAEFEKEQVAPTENEGEKTDNENFTPQALLAAAKEFANGDAALLAMADKVSAKLTSGAEATRGAAGGARSTSDRVYANSYEIYTCTFVGKQFAEVAVLGDGDTDLDLYIYDENWNLIAQDIDYTDRCYCSFTPSWTGKFYIKVKNRGSVYNNFVLLTN